MCAAFDRAATPAEGLDAAIWSLLDVASAAPQWSRFALLEATRSVLMRGIGAIKRSHRCATGSSASCRPTARKDAPQWSVEAVFAALRPQLVGDGDPEADPAAASRSRQPRPHDVRHAGGHRHWPSARRATAAAPGWSAASPTPSSRSTATRPGVDTLRAELDVAIQRRHGPALSHAVRCLVARDDEHDKRLTGLRKPILEALPDGWIFGTPLRYPGPRAYSLNSEPPPRAGGRQRDARRRRGRHSRRHPPHGPDLPAHAA